MKFFVRVRSFRKQVFDREGHFLLQFGRKSPLLGRFSNGLQEPNSVCLVGEFVFVTDAATHKVWVFTREGQFRR